jgi:hypothetical protein
MNRTAFRLSALAALLNGGNKPYPTLAGGNVLDSENEDIPELSGDAHEPVIVVRTENDEQALVGGGRAVQQRALTLRLEVAILTVYRDTAGVLVANWARTTGQLEAFLDLLEYQINAALLGNTIWATYFRDSWSPDNITSAPIYFDAPEGGPRVRMAAREITLTAPRAQADEFPPALLKTDPAVYTPALPPMLVEIFDKIESAGGGDLKDAITSLRELLEAQTLPKEGRYPPFKIARANITLADQPAPPDGEPAFSQIPVELLADPTDGNV